MKVFNYLILFLFSFILFSCNKSTRIVSSWKNSEIIRENEYNSVFVIVLSESLDAKSMIENELAAQAKIRGIKATTSQSVFGPNFTSKGTPTKDELFSKIQTSESEAILTVSVLANETETQYIPGSAAYAPIPTYGWYGDFYGYFGYRYPLIYAPGYFEKDKLYFLETNIYDVASEKLIWSAQSQTINPGGIEAFTKTYVTAILDELKEDDVIF